MRPLPLVLGLLASTVAVTATTTAAPALANTCKAPTRLITTHSPVVRKLPGGVVLRAWDTGPTSDPMASQRIVAVTIPRTSALRGYVAAASALTRSATVGSYASHVPGAVVTVNGSVFDAAKGAIPVSAVMRNGVPLKGRDGRQYMVVFRGDRKADLDELTLVGSAKARGYSWGVTGLNWGTIAGTGINVYTTAWGTARRPYGTVDVVVANGKVVARRTGTSRGAAPTAGQVVLTATGTTGTQLSALRVGDAVTLSYRLASRSGLPVLDAIARGHVYVYNSLFKDGGACSARDEELRPRTALAWTKAGDLIVVTVSGRAVVNGVLYGGSTHHQMPTYLLQLGADRAVGLDGGGSTTMFVRSSVTGSPYRVDRFTSYQRAVPTALGWK